MFLYVDGDVDSSNIQTRFITAAPTMVHGVAAEETDLLIPLSTVSNRGCSLLYLCVDVSKGTSPAI